MMPETKPSLAIADAFRYNVGVCRKNANAVLVFQYSGKFDEATNNNFMLVLVRMSRHKFHRIN